MEGTAAQHERDREGMTARTTAGDAERCIAAGCDAYTTKPIDKLRLIEMCRAAAAGELRRARKAA